MTRRFVAVQGPPLPDGVEVFQTKTDGVDLAMTAGALRLFLMRPQTFARGEGLAVESRDLGDVRRRGRRRVVEKFSQHPGTTIDGARLLAVAPHGKDRGHAKQTATRAIRSAR